MRRVGVAISVVKNHNRVMAMVRFSFRLTTAATGCDSITEFTHALSVLYLHDPLQFATQLNNAQQRNAFSVVIWGKTGLKKNI